MHNSVRHSKDLTLFSRYSFTMTYRTPSRLRLSLRAPSLRSALSVLSIAWAGSTVACGSKDEGDGDGPPTIEPGTTGIDVSTDSSNETTAGNSIDSSDGGRIDLTAEQAEAIDDAACTGWKGEGESLPAVLQLVVDTSFSMTEGAPGTNRSKWDVTRDALLQAMESLPPTVAVGVMFYPNTNDFRTGEAAPGPIDACIDLDGMIPIDMMGTSGSEQRTSISGGITDMDPNGYTPTHDAYRHALNESLIPYESTASKFMLLITDGAPTVNTDCVATGDADGGQQGAVNDAETQPIIDEIAAANTERNIRTFLIGSPGSEESANGNGDMRPWLSEAAMLGGTAGPGCQQAGPEFCHMDMTQEPDFAAALTAGLASVTGQIVNDCLFAVPAPPEGKDAIDPNETNLIITWGDGSSSLILPDGQGDCADGWQWSADDGTVSLCGQTCDEVKLDEHARVQLTFGCTTEEIVVPIR